MFPFVASTLCPSPAIDFLPFMLSAYTLHPALWSLILSTPPIVCASAFSDKTGFLTGFQQASTGFRQAVSVCCGVVGALWDVVVVFARYLALPVHLLFSCGFLSLLLHFQCLSRTCRHGRLQHMCPTHSPGTMAFKTETHNSKSCSWGQSDTCTNFNLAATLLGACARTLSPAEDPALAPCHADISNPQLKIQVHDQPN